MAGVIVFRPAILAFPHLLAMTPAPAWPHLHTPSPDRYVRREESLSDLALDPCEAFRKARQAGRFVTSEIERHLSERRCDASLGGDGLLSWAAGGFSHRSPQGLKTSNKKASAARAIIIPSPRARIDRKERYQWPLLPSQSPQRKPRISQSRTGLLQKKRGPPPMQANTTEGRGWVVRVAS